jgi:hypothetical protein
VDLLVGQVAQGVAVELLDNLACLLLLEGQAFLVREMMADLVATITLPMVRAAAVVVQEPLDLALLQTVKEVTVELD